MNLVLAHLLAWMQGRLLQLFKVAQSTLLVQPLDKPLMEVVALI
jgi:hypothetical protein